MPPPVSLKTKMFYAGGTKLAIQREECSFQCFKDPATGKIKMNIEITFSETVPGNLLKQFKDFNLPEEEIWKIPGLLFFEDFDPANPSNETPRDGGVYCIYDKEDQVVVTASFVVPGSGKTQSAM